MATFDRAPRFKEWSEMAGLLILLGLLVIVFGARGFFVGNAYLALAHPARNYRLGSRLATNWRTSAASIVLIEPS